MHFTPAVFWIPDFPNPYSAAGFVHSCSRTTSFLPPMLLRSIEGSISVLWELILLNEVKAKSMSLSGKSTFLAPPHSAHPVAQRPLCFWKGNLHFATRASNGDQRGPAPRWTVTFLNLLYQVHDTLWSTITPVLKIALTWKKSFLIKQVSKHNTPSFCLGTNTSNTHKTLGSWARKSKIFCYDTATAILALFPQSAQHHPHSIKFHHIFIF